ncbi:MAG TPA: cytochrome c [Myxococcota bacterium]|nr:cytochrome c [Myxococcota bacterium]
MRIGWLLRVGVSVILVCACKPSGGDPVEAGRRAYAANCTACHNPDPSKVGSVGPALAGSPPELVRARVLRAEYPPGYTPQRDTHLMPAQPFLAAEVEGLAAYLGSLPPVPR